MNERCSTADAKRRVFIKGSGAVVLATLAATAVLRA